MTDDKSMIEFNNKKYLVAFKSAEISFPEYDDMKKNVDMLRNQFMKWEVTPDNLTESKHARAKLNKLKTAINRRKIDIVNQANKPVKEFQDKIEDLNTEIAQTSQHIGDQINVYVSKAKADKHEQNCKHIDQWCKEAGLDPDSIEYDPKWDLQSYSYKRFQDDVSKEVETQKKLQDAFEANRKVIIEQAEKLRIGPQSYIDKLEYGEPLDKVLAQMKSERDYLDDMAKKQAERKKKEQQELQAHGDKAIDPHTGEIKDKEYKFSLVFDQMDSQQLQKLASFVKDWGINTSMVAVKFTGTREQVKQLGQFIKDQGLSAKRVK